MRGPHISGTIFFYLILGLLSPAQAAFAQSNSQAPASTNQQGSQEDGNTGGVVLPAPLGGLIPPLANHDEITERVNLLTGGIGVSGLYTDNAFTTGTKTVGDYQYEISPSLGIQSFGQHTQWMLNYAGGATIDQRLPGNTQQTHAATADLTHHFTSRLSSEFRADFSMSNNPFTQTGAGESLPTTAGPGQLSGFAVPAPITRIEGVSIANATYRLSEHSGAGVSGSFSVLRFQNDEALAGAGGTLIDTTNATGRAFYLRQISARQTIGAEYQLQALVFNSGAARARNQAIYFFDGIAFTRNMTLSLYGGPAHTSIDNVIVSVPGLASTVFPSTADQWSFVGGLAYTWHIRRNGFRISADREITDGSAWAGAVELNTARLELQRALGTRWTANINLSYSDGRIIAAPSNFVDDRITTEEGQIGTSCRITKNFSLTADYAHIQQPHTGAFTGNLKSRYNQVQVGFAYRFQKAIFQ